jgi:hypothetical protein
MVIAVGCTPKEQAETEEPTAEVTAEATAEATEEPATEATEEATEEPAIEVTYTEEEVAAAKQVVEDYLTAEEIEAESVEMVADYNVENEMKFTVMVKDQEEATEVVVTRADAESDWTVKTEQVEEA